MDQRDLQDLKDHKVMKDRQDNQDPWDHRDLLESAGHLVCLERTDKMGTMVSLANLELQEHLDSWDQEVFREHQE